MKVNKDIPKQNSTKQKLSELYILVEKKKDENKALQKLLNNLNKRLSEKQK